MDRGGLHGPACLLAGLPLVLAGTVTSDVLEQLELLVLQELLVALGLGVVPGRGAAGDARQLRECTGLQLQAVEVAATAEEHRLTVRREERRALTVGGVGQAPYVHGSAVHQVEVTAHRGDTPPAIRRNVTGGDEGCDLVGRVVIQQFGLTAIGRNTVEGGRSAPLHSAGLPPEVDKLGVVGPPDLSRSLPHQLRAPHDAPDGEFEVLVAGDLGYEVGRTLGGGGSCEECRSGENRQHSGSMALHCELLMG